MRKIALLHTVLPVAASFEGELRAALAVEVKVYNVWDQFLSLDPNDVGVFTRAHQRRLLHDLERCAETGAELVVVTCSTLTPHLPLLRPLIGVPVLAMDEAMLEKALTYGDRVLVVATAGSTIAASAEKIAENAAVLGRSVTVERMVVEPAFRAMQANDPVEHDRLLTEALADVRDYDCIVLAQGSMARCTTAIEAATGIPTLASPALCIAQVKERLEVRE